MNWNQAIEASLQIALTEAVNQRDPQNILAVTKEVREMALGSQALPLPLSGVGVLANAAAQLDAKPKRKVTRRPRAVQKAAARKVKVVKQAGKKRAKPGPKPSTARVKTPKVAAKSKPRKAAVKTVRKPRAKKEKPVTVNVNTKPETSPSPAPANSQPKVRA